MHYTLSFAEWFLVRAGGAFLAGTVMAFLISPVSPLANSTRLRLSFLFSIACLGLPLIPEPMFDVRWHTQRIEALLSAGVACAFGFGFALSRVRLAPRGGRSGGAVLALAHLTILALVIGQEFR
jgi:hypothetical protein